MKNVSVINNAKLAFENAKIQLKYTDPINLTDDIVFISANGGLIDIRDTRHGQQIVFSCGKNGEVILVEYQSQTNCISRSSVVDLSNPKETLEKIKSKFPNLKEEQDFQLYHYGSCEVGYVPVDEIKGICEPICKDENRVYRPKPSESRTVYSNVLSKDKLQNLREECVYCEPPYDQKSGNECLDANGCKETQEWVEHFGKCVDKCQSPKTRNSKTFLCENSAERYCEICDMRIELFERLTIDDYQMLNAEGYDLACDEATQRDFFYRIKGGILSKLRRAKISCQADGQKKVGFQNSLPCLQDLNSYVDGSSRSYSCQMNDVFQATPVFGSDSILDAWGLIRGFDELKKRGQVWPDR